MHRLLFVLAALAACHPSSLRDDRFATGSRTAVASEDYLSLYAVNVDEGSLSAVDTETGAVATVAVGKQPTRVARAGNQLFVTLRGERAIQVLELQAHGAPKATTRIQLGREPYGIVASEDGKRVYVTVSLDDQVDEIDATSHEILRTWAVMNEPRWLALHPSGKALFVASAHGDEVTRIDLRESGDGAGASTTVTLPPMHRNTLAGQVTLTPRVTGDPGVTPNGDEIGFPVLYADTTTPVDSSVGGVDQPTEGTVGTTTTGTAPADTGSFAGTGDFGGSGFNGSGSGYGSSGFNIGRMNAALVAFGLDHDGEVQTDDVEARFLAGIVNGRGNRQDPIARSYASAAIPLPDGDEYAIPLEGSDAILVLRRYPFREQHGGEDVMADSSTGGFNREPTTSPQEAGMVVYPTAAISAEGGPRSLVITGDDEAWVHNFLARSTAEVKLGAVRTEVSDAARDGFSSFDKHATEAPLALATPALDADGLAGQALFYSASDLRMQGSGAGVSCATCHTDGRNDGFTWPINGVRQTPSLAGGASETIPVTWEGDVPSVADEAMITSETRMGGNGLSLLDARRIQMFVDSVPLPDAAVTDDPRIAEGKAIFERADVACATCHPAPTFTDGVQHKILGDLNANTPTLRGIAATAPYFHDGSAPDLRAVLTFARGGAMGDTGMLSTAELDALEAYLRSL